MNSLTRSPSPSSTFLGKWDGTDMEGPSFFTKYEDHFRTLRRPESEKVDYLGTFLEGRAKAIFEEYVRGGKKRSREDLQQPDHVVPAQQVTDPRRKSYEQIRWQILKTIYSPDPVTFYNMMLLQTRQGEEELVDAYIQRMKRFAYSANLVQFWNGSLFPSSSSSSSSSSSQQNRRGSQSPTHSSQTRANENVTEAKLMHHIQQGLQPKLAKQLATFKTPSARSLETLRVLAMNAEKNIRNSSSSTASASASASVATSSTGGDSKKRRRSEAESESSSSSPTTPVASGSGLRRPILRVDTSRQIAAPTQPPRANNVNASTLSPHETLRTPSSYASSASSYVVDSGASNFAPSGLATPMANAMASLSLLPGPLQQLLAMSNANEGAANNNNNNTSNTVNNNNSNNNEALAVTLVHTLEGLTDLAKNLLNTMAANSTGNNNQPRPNRRKRKRGGRRHRNREVKRQKTEHHNDYRTPSPQQPQPQQFSNTFARHN